MKYFIISTTAATQN